jgi:hypothetical protein
MKSITPAKVQRVAETGGRAATVLENGLVRVMVDDKGGMIPELSAVRDGGFMNAHWLPEFRSNSGKPFPEKNHSRVLARGSSLFHRGELPLLPQFRSGRRTGRGGPPSPRLDREPDLEALWRGGRRGKRRRLGGLDPAESGQEAAPPLEEDRRRHARLPGPLLEPGDIQLGRS